MTPSEDWVTVAQCSWLPEAMVLKSMLENSGIEAFIPEQFISTINPGVTGVQVRVQVRESFVEEAKRLIEDSRDPALAEHAKKCPDCGSTEVKISPIGVRGWLSFIACALVMVPMSAGRSRKVCGGCGRSL
jgi:Putative prokaryotic signal transducing protein